MPHSTAEGLKNYNLCSLRIYDKESGPGPLPYKRPDWIKSESTKVKQVQLRLGQIVNFDFGRGIKGKSAYVMPLLNKAAENYEKVKEEKEFLRSENFPRQNSLLK